MSYVDTKEFYRQGYAVVPVLTPEEAARYASIADEWVASGSPGDFITIPEIPQVLGHPAVQDAIRQILGTTELILETWKLMAIDRGDTYRQGWHRDIPLGTTWLPDETADQLLDAIATDRWFHNNVQCNLALTPDACYWVVPGSNCRAFTTTERAVFEPIIAANDHLASRPNETDVGIPGGISVAVEPGEMIVQNNVSIHRGWGIEIPERRRTLHFGFHAGHRPPTWHFRRKLNDVYEALDAAERENIHPLMRALLERRAARMRDFTPSDPGDEAWRQANMDLFFSGGFIPEGEARV